VTVDRKGVIHQWGDAGTDIVGYSADATLGRSLNLVIPPVLRPLHWWGFDQAMKSGRLNRENLKVPALRKDGRIVVVHW
jgi:PAS domain S-box-containing protein